MWLVHIGQNLLLWGVLGAVSLVGATLILNLLQLLVIYFQKWNHMRPIPSIPGAYPFVGHSLILKPDGKGKGQCSGPPHPSPWAGGRPALAAQPRRES